jgi:sugar lactone lactonase YvrE
MSLKRRSWQLSPVAALLVLLGSAEQVRAGQIIYASSLEGERIVRVDTGTNQVTTIDQQNRALDSLVFTPQGNIVYTAINDGQVWMYNVTTHADTLLAHGLGSAQDLALDPSGTSVLVTAGPSVNTLGNLFRVKLSGGATLIAQYNSSQGLAYDPSGKLYGNINGTVDRLDPNTGAILQTGQSGLNQLDGLTYDSYTHMLYASAQFSSMIYAIDPTTLTATVLTDSSPGPDGIVADGKGNLFFGSRSKSDIYQYDLTNHTLTQLSNVFGLDDLAPVSGSGSGSRSGAPANAVPEPTSLAVIAFGAFWLIGYSGRRRNVGLTHFVAK